MDNIRPGKDGEPLPHGTLVFRVGKNAWLSDVALEGRKALPVMFEPSSDDKKSKSKCISIWVEALTVADQGWAIMGAKPAYTAVACLDSEKVRAIPPTGEFQPFQVQWEQAVVRLDDGTEVPNTAPGAAGHAGIWGLIQGKENKTDGLKRKDMRSKLADIADVSPVPVPHDIPEEHLQEAAYYVYLMHGDCACAAEDHWVAAVRQLRRARVQEDREARGLRSTG